MYFDDLKLDMTADTAPTVIEKGKMLQFAYDYDNVPLHTVYGGMGKVFGGRFLR